jgi:hypothetical protein
MALASQQVYRFTYGEGTRKGRLTRTYRLHFNYRHKEEDQARWFVVHVQSNTVVETGDDAQVLQIKYRIK